MKQAPFKYPKQKFAGEIDHFVILPKLTQKLSSISKWAKLKSVKWARLKCMFEESILEIS